MNDTEILSRLGFSVDAQNPFSLVFDPGRPEPPGRFFRDPRYAPLAEPYRAYREALREALGEHEEPPALLGLGFSDKALEPLARLLAALPEGGPLMVLGRFLLEWAEDGFEAFPDGALESAYGQALGESASLWFDDLVEELNRAGFELSDYEVDAYGYRNHLKGSVHGTFSKKALEEIEAALPSPVAEAAAALYVEAARFAEAETLIEEAYEPTTARNLIELLRETEHPQYRTLLLHLVAGDLDAFAEAVQDLDAADLAEKLGADYLEKSNSFFNVPFDDRDRDDPLQEEARRLQEALRSWYERELEGSLQDRLDWLARAYEDGRFELEDETRLTQAA